MARVGSALALVLLSRGVPIVYSGTEQGFEGSHFDNRIGLWQSNYSTQTQQYALLAGLHRIRREQQIGTGVM